jgi:protein-disulfide isomerase
VAKTTSERLSTLGSAAVVLCAIVLTGLVVRRELFPASPEHPADRVVDDWREYAAEGRRSGRADAPVTIVVFSDFQCPACRQLADQLDSVRARHPRDVAVVYRHFPLTPVHPYAQAAALASECAGGQGRFEAFHDALFREQALVGIGGWRHFATAARVPDLDAFDRCVADPAPNPAIARDFQAGRKLGVTGTPTLLINERRVQGTPPLDELEAYVRRALRG